MVIEQLSSSTRTLNRIKLKALSKAVNAEQDNLDEKPGEAEVVRERAAA